jgi:hypothetical protein
VPDLHHFKRDQHGQQERAGHLHVLRSQQHAAAVDAVGDHAADQRKQQNGDLSQEAVEAQHEGRSRDRKTSQLCATTCIQVPIDDVQAPNHSRRNSR